MPSILSWTARNFFCTSNVQPSMDLDIPRGFLCAAMASVSLTDEANQVNGWKQSMGSAMANPTAEEALTHQRLEGRANQIRNFSEMESTIKMLETIHGDGGHEEKKQEFAPGGMRVAIANLEESKPKSFETKTDGFTPPSKRPETKSDVKQTPDELNAKLEAVGGF